MVRPKKEKPMKNLNITLTQEQYELLQSKGNKSAYIREALDNNGKNEALTQKLDAEKRELTGINITLQQQIITLKRFLEEGKFKVYSDEMNSQELKFLEEL